MMPDIIIWSITAFILAFGVVWCICDWRRWNQRFKDVRDMQSQMDKLDAYIKRYIYEGKSRALDCPWENRE